MVVVGGEPVDVGRRRPGHRLDPAGHDQVLEAGPDAHCPEVDRLLARAAEPVQGHARCLDRPAGIEGRVAGDVHRVVTAAGAATHDDIVDLGGVESVPVPQGVEHLGQNPLGVHVVEGAGLLPLASRGTNGVNDVSLGHAPGA